jgi:hypothetical protein
VVALTLVASALLFGLVLWLLMYLRRPSYRIDVHNVVRLLASVERGDARYQDWLVFTAMPIRYDPALEAIRLRCLAIEERHLLGDQGAHLFDTEGRAQLRALLSELDTQSDR